MAIEQPMKLLATTPSLTEQTYRSILSEIATGRLASGSRIIQQDLAAQLGVSRQPVQQALTLLRTQGVLVEAPGRGLLVAPLDPDHVRHMYDVRSVIEGLAFRKAAELQGAKARDKGDALIRAGRKAVASGSVAALISADMAFHAFIYRLSGNPLVAPSMDTHWTHAQRVMGEVLNRDNKPRDVWDEHDALLDAVCEGQGERAEQLARRHILGAADFMLEQLDQASR